VIIDRVALRSFVLLQVLPDLDAARRVPRSLGVFKAWMLETPDEESARTQNVNALLQSDHPVWNALEDDVGHNRVERSPELWQFGKVGLHVMDSETLFPFRVQGVAIERFGGLDSDDVGSTMSHHAAEIALTTSGIQDAPAAHIAKKAKDLRIQHGPTTKSPSGSNAVRSSRGTFPHASIASALVLVTLFSCLPFHSIIPRHYERMFERAPVANVATSPSRMASELRWRLTT